MCEVVSGQEEFLDIPSSLVKRKCGFSLDAGLSVIKVVCSAELPAGDVVRFYFVSFPIDRMEEALEYAKNKMAGKIAEGENIYTCGINCNLNTKSIEEKLNVRLVNVMENDCFVDAFQFLTKQFPLEDLVHPQSEKVTKYAAGIRAAFVKMQHSLCTDHQSSCRGAPWKSTVQFLAREAEKEKETVDESSKKLKIEEPATVEYPMLIYLVGSASSPMQVEEDGNYLCLDILSISGRTFLGLGSLLTGAKTFEELTALAEKGSAEKVDILLKHLQMGGEDDVYASLSNDYTAFAMGHAAGKDLSEFSREDLAAGALSIVCQSLAMSFHMWALVTKVKQAFFFGGLHTNSRLIRDELGKHFAARCLMNPLGLETKFYFVKLGAYLGALGGLLKTLNE